MHHLFFIFCTFFLLGHMPAHADRYTANKLSKNSIKKFISDTADMISEANNTKQTDRISSFLDRHVSDAAKFESTLTYIMPGLPSQEQTLYLMKKDYISNIIEGTANIDNHSNTIKIKKVDLSRNKSKATIKTVGTEDMLMQMPIPGTQSTQSVNVSGESECTQEIILGTDDAIQMHSANCVTVITFAMP